MANDPDIGPIAGPAVHTFIEGQLAHEESRSASLETRGQALITTCGTLISVLSVGLGFLNVARGGHSLRSVSSPELLATALPTLLLAFCCGIIVNVPRQHAVAAEDRGGGLLDLIAPEVYWAPESKVTRRLTEERIAELTQMRRVNARKAQVVQVGQWLEVLALGFAGVALLMSAG